MIKLKFSKLNLPAILALAALVLVGGYFGYNYYKANQELREYKGDIQLSTIKEKNDLLKQLSKIAVLPQDEEPSIATVTDAFRLRGQKFFAQTENGDKVIIYSEAGRALLYRPSLKKIIESAPVNLAGFTDTPENQQASDNFVIDSAQKTPEPVIEEVKEKTARVAIYNGTLFVSGLASQVAAYLESELAPDMLSIEIVANAENEYDETIIIDVSGEAPKALAEISALLNAQLLESPEDVTFPEVDIVVVAGKNIDLDLFQ